MILKNKMLSLGVSLLGMTCISYAEQEELASSTFEIQGEVPKGWEVVELADAPAIEKWIEMKDGQKKKVLVKPFGLKPAMDKSPNFTVSNPLENALGEKMEEVLEAQNFNLARSEEELSGLLNRLKALLSSLPQSTESKK